VRWQDYAVTLVWLTTIDTTLAHLIELEHGEAMLAAAPSCARDIAAHRSQPRASSIGRALPTQCGPRRVDDRTQVSQRAPLGTAAANAAHSSLLVSNTIKRMTNSSPPC
jgi:hypothetical protein